MSLQNNVPMAGMNQPPGQRQPQGFAHGQGGPGDIESVRRNYREALYELTFNSKPIITNLTIMAQENQYAAGAIVREIEQQIRHNASGQKLPVLYLIDSICKNVGGVYIEHFARDIASTFLDAYTVTDPSNRRSFERLLQTWKNGMPNGAPVFSRQIIESIERPLNYIRSRNQGQQQQQPPHPHPQQHHQQHQQQQHYPHPQQQHNQQAQQYHQQRFSQSPQQQQAASPRNQQIHVNPNFVPKRDPRDPRSRNAYTTQERQSRPMPPVSKPPAATQSPSLGAPTNDILSTLQSMLPRSSAPSQVMNTTPAGSNKGASDPVAQLVSQIQSILPSLPPDQSGAIQEFLNQILGSNSAPSQATIGNMLNNLPFTMPPVSAPIAASTPPVAVVPPPPAPATSIVGNIARLSHSPPVYRAPAPPVTTTAQPLPVPSPVPPQAVVASQPQPQPQPVAGLPINTAELLQGLTSMGILSSSGNTPTPPPTTATTTTGNNDNSSGNSNVAIGSPAASSATTTTAAASGGASTGAGGISEKGPSTALKELGPFRLESKDLQIVRPGAVELLYSGLPLQCKQCGFRYPKTTEGQNKMDAHLDSHFRQNRRMKERVKRGLSRSWFVTEEEWISGSGGELTSHQAPAFLTDNTSNEVNMASPSAGGTTDTVNPESHMVVMPNDENRKPCPICGERFVDFWNDDEEEWMYKNAVMVDDTIYHATCHADAVKSGTLVGSDGPEDTEMAESSQGIKRKAEDEDMMKEDVKTARISKEQDQ